MLGAEPVLDAGDAENENLGAAGRISVIGNWQDKLGAGLFGPAPFFIASLPRYSRNKPSRISVCLDEAVNDRSTRPPLGVVMSALGQKQSCAAQKAMSAFEGEATLREHSRQ